MSQVIITANNVGKKYSLKHLSGKSKDDMFFGSIKAKARGLFSKSSEEEEFWALKDVSFEINKGDRVAILGRNGAGKSTLLKILSRIVAPTTGRIEFEGRMASLLEVGTGFHGDLTGRENIFLNGSILGMTKSEIKSKFDEIVEFSEVEKFLDTPVKRYSSGMYVRLAFAVAAHLDPEILIVDEVLAVGDAAFQKKCLGKMRDVSKNEGRTILFVSHQLNSLQSLCNKGFVLSKGEMSLGLETIENSIKHYVMLGNKIAGSSIADRKDREGEAKIKTQDILFYNANNKRVDEIISGERITIHVIFKCSEDFIGSDVNVALAVYGDDGTLFTVLNSESSGVGFNKIKGEGKFQCALDKFPLMEGNYYINVSINERGLLQDWVQEAVFFNVLGGDFYGTGRITPSSHRSVLIENHWSI